LYFFFWNLIPPAARSSSARSSFPRTEVGAAAGLAGAEEAEGLPEEEPADRLPDGVSDAREAMNKGF
jgi:hypothetical protein